MPTEGMSYLRNEIGEYLSVLGEMHPSVVMVTADLAGTCRTTKFAEKYPERSFNTGIAEQNMVSFAAGLAHEGFIPYVFSMAPFISMRACEQCRTDIAYGRLNVRLFATYAGYSGGISGATHWGLEDCAIMSSIPEMVVLEPSSSLQAKKMMDASIDYQGPIYMRSSVLPVKEIYDEKIDFEIGKAITLLSGDEGMFICSGNIVQYALEAAKRIEDDTGRKIGVIDMHTIKPIDEKAIIKAAATGRIVVAQDHSVIGGLGYQVASVLVKHRLSPEFKILGCQDTFIPMAHAEYLYHKYKYDTEGLIEEMKGMLN